MMIHHSNQDYNVAASEAAKFARDKINKLIEAGRDRSARVVEQVLTQVPEDRIVPASKLAERIGVMLDAVGTDKADVRPKLVVDFGSPEQPLPGTVQHIHRNALGQLAERAGVPYEFMRKTMDKGEWGTRLVAHNLREMYAHDDSKYLCRSVDGELRGVLSDSYRRLDSRPLLDTFATAASELGMIPIEGHALDTKVALKMILPLIFEPIANEVMCFGLSWGNSDFGKGGHTVNAFVYRIGCTNLAMFENLLRQIHLGKRLSEDFEYSKKTYELDMETSVSALRDIVKGALGPGQVNTWLEQIKLLGSEKIDTGVVVERLKTKLTKDEVKQVKELFSSAEIELLPPGQTMWRMSNALSLLAGRTGDEERRIELERYAGEVLEIKKAA